jgi:hypothetical protein
MGKKIITNNNTRTFNAMKQASTKLQLNESENAFAAVPFV